MSDLVKEKEIVLDKPRKIKFNFRTIMIFEEKTKKNFFKLGGEFSGTDTLTLLYACLKSAGEDITLEQTADLIDLNNLPKISEAIQSLVSQSMPEANKSAGGDGPLEAKPLY